MNTKYYNEIVNCSHIEDENCTNFIDSLEFRNSIFKCISILEEIENIYDSKASIYPSFIGKHIKDTYEVSKDSDFDGTSIFFEFEEYDSKELIDDLNNQSQFNSICKFSFNEDELIKLTILA